jgi:hypothetical protein
MRNVILRSEATKDLSLRSKRSFASLGMAAAVRSFASLRMTNAGDA